MIDFKGKGQSNSDLLGGGEGERNNPCSFKWYSLAVESLVKLDGEEFETLGLHLTYLV